MNESHWVRHLQIITQADSTQSEIIPIGDDCAVFESPKYLMQSIDTSTENIHFPETMRPESIGYRSVATAISDIVAMGGRPLSHLLSIQIPHKKTKLLPSILQGAQIAAQWSNSRLIGGDTTTGQNLSITCHVNGYLDNDERPICRNGAMRDDDIYISGSIGLGYLGLGYFLDNHKSTVPLSAIKHFCRPRLMHSIQPILQAFATSAIDVSDGLIIDINRIAEASSAGFIINLEDVPLPDNINQVDTMIDCVTKGDDYRIAFTANKIHRNQLDSQPTIKRIGTITATEKEIRYQSKAIPIAKWGFDHFS